jgi:hypothetical protein
MRPGFTTIPEIKTVETVDWTRWIGPKESENLAISWESDSIGILLIDYLQNGETINGQYYTILLAKLKTVIQEKLPGMVKKKVLFHHNNTPVHSNAGA